MAARVTMVLRPSASAISMIAANAASPKVRLGEEFRQIYGLLSILF